MKIFGGWLPFLGFREYTYTDLPDYYLKILEEDGEDVEDIVAITFYTFEFEWFEYAIGLVYKTRTLKEIK